MALADSNIGLLVIFLICPLGQMLLPMAKCILHVWVCLYMTIYKCMQQEKEKKREKKGNQSKKNKI